METCHILPLFLVMSLLHINPSLSQDTATIVGWTGHEATLPCNFSVELRAVFWYRLNQTHPEEKVLKASLFKGERSGISERFVLNLDNSLTIRDLGVHDEGTYRCDVSTEIGSETYRVLWDLAIYALPFEPVIEQCDETPLDTSSSSPPAVSSPPNHCTTSTSRSFPKFNMVCRVGGFRPEVSVVWSVVEDGVGRDLQPLGTSEKRAGPNGTFDMDVTVSVDAKERLDQNFTCTVSGEATNGTDLVTHITVKALPAISPEEKKGLSSGVSAVIVIFSLVLVFIVVVLVLLSLALYLRKRDRLPPQGHAILDRIPWLKRPAVSDQELKAGSQQENTDEKGVDDEERLLQAEQRQEERSSLRAAIRGYIPGQFGKVQLGQRDSPVTIALFGLMGTGKSAFINSLVYALSGEYASLSEEGSVLGGGETSARLPYPLVGGSGTPELARIVDNRGMKDFADNNMFDIRGQIRGERGLDPTKPLTRSEKKENDVHCPVFVYCSRGTANAQAMGFISMFTKEIQKFYNRSPLLVVTRKDDIKDVNQLSSDLLSSGIPKENIWYFENYTSDNHVEDVEKDIVFLKFLKFALRICDLNLYNLEIAEREELQTRSRCVTM